MTNGVTGVNSAAFGRSAINNSNAIRVNGSQLQNAGVVRGVLPLTPGRESLRMADRAVSTSTMSRATAAKSFYSRQPASSAGRVPFEQQRQTMERAAQRTFGNSGAGWPRAGGTGSGRPFRIRADGIRLAIRLLTRLRAQRVRARAGQRPSRIRDGVVLEAREWRVGSAIESGGTTYTPSNSNQPVRINPPMVRERHLVLVAARAALQRAAPPRSSGGGGGGASLRQAVEAAEAGQAVAQKIFFFLRV